MSEPIHNLISLLVHHAQTRPKEVALRHKTLGLWQQWSWQKLLQLTTQYAVALRQYGFQKEQHLLIVSPPNVDVVALSLAVQAIGGVVQLLDHDEDQLTSDQLQRHLQVIKPDYIFVESLAQLGNVNVLQKHPTYIFYLESDHLDQHHHEYIVSIQQLLDDAQSHEPIAFEALQLKATDIAFVFEKITQDQHLSATYSHQTLLEQAKQLIAHHHLDHQQDAFIARAFSSVGHIRYLWSTWLLAGFTLNIPETLDTRDQDRQVIAPTLVLGTVATYTRVQHIILAKLPEQCTWLYQRYQLAISKLTQQQSLNVLDKGILALFKQVILEELGFTRLNTALIVADRVPDSLIQFYAHLGIVLHPWGQQAEWQQKQAASFVSSAVLNPLSATS